MKRNSLLFGGIMLGVVALMPTLIYAAPAKVNVIRENVTTVATSSTDQSVGTVVPTKIDYTLPYPGILADNPLYMLKEFRDTIMEWLIADPLRKIEFYVLQSDKSLNAGIFLNMKGKTALANDAITDGSTFSEKAVTIASTLKSQGKEVPDYIMEHLGTSLAKHEEVLVELIDKAASGQKATIESALQVVKKLEVDVGKMK